MAYPNWPQFTPGPPVVQWLGRSLNPYDPRWLNPVFNYRYALAEGHPNAVYGDVTYNNDFWAPPAGLLRGGSVWDAFNTSCNANFGTAQERSRSMGLPLRWGLSRGIKFKDNGGAPPEVPPP